MLWRYGTGQYVGGIYLVADSSGAFLRYEPGDIFGSGDFKAAVQRRDSGLYVMPERGGRRMDAELILELTDKLEGWWCVEGRNAQRIFSSEKPAEDRPAVPQPRVRAATPPTKAASGAPVQIPAQTRGAVEATAAQLKLVADALRHDYDFLQGDGKGLVLAVRFKGSSTWRTWPSMAAEDERLVIYGEPLIELLLRRGIRKVPQIPFREGAVAKRLLVQGQQGFRVSNGKRTPLVNRHAAVARLKNLLDQKLVLRASAEYVGGQPLRVTGIFETSSENVYAAFQERDVQVITASAKGQPREVYVAVEHGKGVEVYVFVIRRHFLQPHRIEFELPADTSQRYLVIPERACALKTA